MTRRLGSAGGVELYVPTTEELAELGTQEPAPPPPPPPEPDWFYRPDKFTFGPLDWAVTSGQGASVIARWFDAQPKLRFDNAYPAYSGNWTVVYYRRSDASTDEVRPLEAWVKEQIATRSYMNDPAPVPTEPAPVVYDTSPVIQDDPIPSPTASTGGRRITSSPTVYEPAPLVVEDPVVAGRRTAEPYEAEPVPAPSPPTSSTTSSPAPTPTVVVPGRSMDGTSAPIVPPPPTPTPSVWMFVAAGLALYLFVR